MRFKSFMILAALFMVACHPAEEGNFKLEKPDTGTPEGEVDPNAPVALANATVKDVGKVLASDKYIYASSALAKDAGAKVCGVVVYVGNDTGDATYRHGLAISMKNFNGNGSVWKITNGTKDNPAQYKLLSEALDAKESGYALTHTGDRTTNSYLWEAFYYTYWNNTGSDENTTTVAPANTSGWFLPSIFQWNQIINGLNGNEAKLTIEQNASLSMFYANEKLTALGAQGLKDGAYWSSSEHSDNNAWLYWANYGKATDSNKTWNYYIRSVLAF